MCSDCNIRNRFTFAAAYAPTVNSSGQTNNEFNFEKCYFTLGAARQNCGLCLVSKVFPYMSLLCHFVRKTQGMNVLQRVLLLLKLDIIHEQSNIF